jgi:hypothetical protein
MKTIRIKVSAANNTQLDWLVAKCEGLPIRRDPMAFGISSVNGGYWVWDETPRGRMSRIGKEYSPTNDPALMWLITHRKKIATRPAVGHHAPVDGWQATTWPTLDWPHQGETSLVAAARCHITSTLGPVVDVPIDLIETAPQVSQDNSVVDEETSDPAPGQ